LSGYACSVDRHLPRRWREPALVLPVKEALVSIGGCLDQLGLDSGTLISFGRRDSVLEKRAEPVITGTTALRRDITLLTA